MLGLPLQYKLVGYNQTCKDGVVVPPSNKQAWIFKAEAQNNSGGAINVGICKKLNPDITSIYSWTALGTPKAVDISTAIKAGTSTQIVSTTVNDGFVVQADEKFNVISFVVSQAQSGSPVYAISYWNGTSFATLSTFAMVSNFALGEAVMVFPAPIDWVAGGGDGLATKYSIRVIATTVTGTAIKINKMSVSQLIKFQQSVADKASLEFKVDAGFLPLILDGKDEVLPYFGGTANVLNSLSVEYSIQG